MLKSRDARDRAPSRRASRSRAQAAADALGIPKAHGSYEALLADPAIEAIYNPLPNHLHVPMTLAAAQAGKHVLCEKPMAMTAAELEVLRPYASQRAHPRSVHGALPSAMDRRARGAAARRDRRAALRPDAVQLLQRRPRRTSATCADIGGGALYDIGCYAIVAGRWFFEARPAARDRGAGSRSGVRHRPHDQRRCSISAAGGSCLHRVDAGRALPAHPARRHARAASRSRSRSTRRRTRRAATAIDDASTLDGSRHAHRHAAGGRPVPVAGRSLSRAVRNERARCARSTMPIATCASSMRCSRRRRAGASSGHERPGRPKANTAARSAKVPQLDDHRPRMIERICSRKSTAPPLAGWRTQSHGA